MILFSDIRLTDCILPFVYNMFIFSTIKNKRTEKYNNYCIAVIFFRDFLSIKVIKYHTQFLHDSKMNCENR